MQFRHQRGPIAELLRTAPVTYIVFDLLQLGDEVLLTTPYVRRRALLAELSVTSTPVAVPRHFTAEDIDPNELLAIVEEQDLEGLVAKRLESRYHPGQRSRDWIKRPLTKTQDVLVGGWRPGKGNRSGRVGGLLLGAHNAHDRLRYIGDVDTGFTERAHRSMPRTKKRRRCRHVLHEPGIGKNHAAVVTRRRFESPPAPT